MVADSWWARLRGLAWRREPPDGWALLFPRCRSVHTFGMRFPIDVVFLDRHGWPIAIRRARQAAAASSAADSAAAVIEMQRRRRRPSLRCGGMIRAMAQTQTQQTAQPLARGLQPAGPALSGRLQRVPPVHRLGDRVGRRDAGAALPRHGAHGPVVVWVFVPACVVFELVRDLLHRPAADEAARAGRLGRCSGPAPPPSWRSLFYYLVAEPTLG